MDEETLRKEFEEWLSRNSYQIGLLWEFWLESASRADKRARKECVAMCERRANSLRGGTAEAGARQCAKDILSTIPE